MRSAIFNRLALASLLILPAFSARAQNTNADVQVSLNVNAFLSAWLVTAVNPTTESVATLGAENPLITLRVGKRYRFNNIAYGGGFHPFAQLARGIDMATDAAPALIQGFGTGTAETQPSIDWFDDGAGSIYFTVTPALISALRQAGKTAGYRCQVHEPMRGDFAFLNQPSNLVWSAGKDDFEATPLGASVPEAITGWSIVNGSASYQAVMAATPVGAPNQPVGSTRWLTVTDTNTTASNRVYSPSVIVPAPATVGSYTWSFRSNVQALGPNARVRWLVQHFAGAYGNVAGIEVTSTTVSAIVMGNDLGGIGTSGTTQRAPLYTMGQSGGFGLNQWIDHAFTISFSPSGSVTLNTRATGSDGLTQVSASIGGFLLAGTNLDPGNFRFCLRNEGTGNTSTISYDEIALAGSSSLTNVGRAWTTYE